MVAEELDSVMLEAPFTCMSSPVSFASEQALQVCMLVWEYRNSSTKWPLLKYFWHTCSVQKTSCQRVATTLDKI